jgi:hypothetical protein
LRKKLLLLDLALAAITAILANQAHDKWAEAEKREQVALGKHVNPVPPPPYAPLAAVQPLTAAAYSDVAQKNLFSGDRNPTIIVEVAPPKPPTPPKPVPEFPVFYGVMNLGNGPLVMMSEKQGQQEHMVRFGEKIGEFKLVAANREQVVLTWDGKEFKKTASELAPKGSVPEAPRNNNAFVPGAPSASARTETAQNASSKPVEAAPGADIGVGVKACLRGDNSPNGTVRDGMRKFVTSSPFGTVCRWEPVR